LECYPTLIEELWSNPDFADKDLTTLKLTVLNSYDVTIKEVDKAIKHLIYYVAANKNSIETIKDEQLIKRVRLAKMLGITRQTLTTWINKGFITPQKSKYLSDVETFNTDTVLEELRKHKTEHSEKEYKNKP
jgi:DNA-binding transcriptional MerR regulator